ncbi:putative major facilitator, sugar transporter, major facilitator superfamily [Septoria linicola]|nr:putative major facilitator, sugar transporter, major facilitator superfamily [Septoria linicola]
MSKEVNDTDVERVIVDIRAVLEEERKDGPFRFAELFTWGKVQNLRRLLITISVQLGQQATGSNMINYYAPVIFQDSMGMTRNMALILGGAAQFTYLVGSIIPVFLMDRFGRRGLLLSCTAGLCVCFVAVSALLSQASDTNRGPAYGATAFIFIFQLVYGVGWLPVPWFYPTEINTTRVRSRMQAIASGWNWMSVFAVVKITPISSEQIQWRTFVVFAVLNAAFIPMVYFFYPEIKGIELEDIPLLFAKGGITGGVASSKGGRTVVPHQHGLETHVNEKIDGDHQEIEQI